MIEIISIDGVKQSTKMVCTKRGKPIEIEKSICVKSYKLAQKKLKKKQFSDYNNKYVYLIACLNCEIGKGFSKHYEHKRTKSEI